jgi:hypothetical protein
MQDLVAALVVLAAVAYLIWKWGFAGMRAKRKPDVPIGRLTQRASGVASVCKKKA